MTTGLAQLVGNLLMGAALGMFLALSVIVGHPDVLNMVVNSAFPGLAAWVFVGALSSMIAVGSAITGFIFSAVERM